MSYKVGQIMEELYGAVAEQCRNEKPVNTVDLCNMIEDNHLNSIQEKDGDMELLQTY